jgi:hypothetical protein
LFLVSLRVFTDDDLGQVTFDAEPVVVVPTPREVRDLQHATVAMMWHERLVVRAPGWSGTVTAVYVEAGAGLTQGQRVLAIDGVDRVAFASATPFYRQLESGDRGPDVAALQELLLATGFIDAVPADAEFLSFATSLAVGAFNESLGAGDSRVFDPATVVWLPYAPFVVESLDLEVGAPAPGPGSVIASGPATLVSATFEAQNPAEPIVLDPGVSYVLVKGDQRWPFDTTTMSLSEDGLAAFGKLVEPLAEQTDAVVERETPLETLAVPSTAIVANAAGDLCAWISDAAAGTGYRSVAVTLAGSQAGVTNVASGVAPTDQVLANPSDVLEEWACP